MNVLINISKKHDNSLFLILEKKNCFNGDFYKFLQLRKVKFFFLNLITTKIKTNRKFSDGQIDLLISP